MCLSPDSASYQMQEGAQKISWAWLNNNELGIIHSYCRNNRRPKLLEDQSVLGNHANDSSCQLSAPEVWRNDRWCSRTPPAVSKTPTWEFRPQNWVKCLACSKEVHLKDATEKSENWLKNRAPQFYHGTKIDNCKTSWTNGFFWNN